MTTHSHLLQQGEWVVEIDRPARPARRNGANTDALDAVRAGREALAREYLAQPRRRAVREAIRVLLTTREGAMRARSKAICYLKSLLVNAPEGLRRRLQGLPTLELLTRCAHLRTSLDNSLEHRFSILAPRTTARRALALEIEADELESQLDLLVQQAAAVLLTEPGVNVISVPGLVSHYRGRRGGPAAGSSAMIPLPLAGTPVPAGPPRPVTLTDRPGSEVGALAHVPRVLAPTLAEDLEQSSRGPEGSRRVRRQPARHEERRRAHRR